MIEKHIIIMKIPYYNYEDTTFKDNIRFSCRVVKIVLNNIKLAKWSSAY